MQEEKSLQGGRGRERERERERERDRHSGIHANRQTDRTHVCGQAQVLQDRGIEALKVGKVAFDNVVRLRTVEGQMCTVNVSVYVSLSHSVHVCAYVCVCFVAANLSFPFGNSHSHITSV